MTDTPTTSAQPEAHANHPRLSRWTRLLRRVYNNGRQDGPPDLDELWRDFRRKLTGILGGGGQEGWKPSGQGGGQEPDMKSASAGLGLMAGVVALIWLGSGVFIVQEGQQSVITTFGSYSKTVDAGIQWRLPYPIQQHETVAVAQLRSKDIGRQVVVPSTGLRDSSMLTQDENIVDIRFTVQYTLKDARDFLYENAATDDAVEQAAESAVREIVGRSKVDSVLYERRDAIAAELAKSVQTQLDRLKAGVSIKSVNLKNVEVPEKVQDAFDDAIKAGADRERYKNEGQAYASDVIPKAQGKASRLKEDAEAYKAAVVSRAKGDAERFASVLSEYQKAPTVTRDRLYIDAMREVYSGVTKVMVDSRSGSNMLYLPLDKIMQSGSQPSANPGTATNAANPNAPAPSAETGSERGRESGLRSRDRDAR